MPLGMQQHTIWLTASAFQAVLQAVGLIFVDSDSFPMLELSRLELFGFLTYT